MRLLVLGAAALALTATACESTGYGGGGYGGGGGSVFGNLSSCQRNALIGAGVGALAGGVVAGEGAKTEGALLGGALGAAGTYGVCRYMDQNSAQRVQNGYYSALNTGQPYSTSWQGSDGTRSLYVADPVASGANCQRLSATLTVPGQGAQQLPPETYCRDPSGQWRPAA